MKDRHRNLPFRVQLTIWLVMAIGFAACQWSPVRQDNVIAPREQQSLALAVILACVLLLQNERSKPAMGYEH